MPVTEDFVSWRMSYSYLLKCLRGPRPWRRKAFLGVSNELCSLFQYRRLSVLGAIELGSVGIGHMVGANQMAGAWHDLYQGPPSMCPDCCIPMPC